MSSDEGKFPEGIVDKLQEFCSSGNMEMEFEDFAKDHVDIFMSSLVILSDGVAEHPIEFHTVYRKYLTQFESKIVKFIEQVG